MATRARSDFTWFVVHVGSLALDFPEILVESLQEYVAVRGDLETGRSVRLHGHNAPLHSRPERRFPTGTADIPAPSTFIGLKFAVPHLQGHHIYDLLSPFGDAEVNVSRGGVIETLTLQQGIVHSKNFQQVH